MASLASTAANAIPLVVEPIGTNKGRLTADKAALLSPHFKPTTRVVDHTLNRLTVNLEKWSGRRDANQQPFPYEAAVKHPQSSDAVGGGIHLGECAQYAGQDDLSHAILVYESDRCLLLRDGKTGAEWVVDSQVDPTTLRALYRFAMSGHNAAISIG